MPIERYRSVAETPELERVLDPDEGMDRLDELWHAGQLLADVSPIPRGVQRFESVMQASRARDEMLARRMRLSRVERALPPTD